MLYVVTGGSGSGKSEYAEQKLCELCARMGGETKIYLATMIPWGEETLQKIERHRKLRKDKGFLTLECYYELKQFVKERISGQYFRPFVLLECMSNLTANEMFREEANRNNVAEKIIEGIQELEKNVCALVVVTNEVCSDSILYSEDMWHYRQTLAKINCALAAEAVETKEIVCGLTANVGSAKSNPAEVLFMDDSAGTFDTERRRKKKAGMERTEKRQDEKREEIRLVVGGTCQGKTAWAKKQYPEAEWLDGAACDLEHPGPAEGVLHLETYIRRWMEKKREPVADQIQRMIKENPRRIFLCDEIGCGLVPVDAFERAYREETGRICTMLAERAVRVDRVVCGIAVTIKPGREF